MTTLLLPLPGVGKSPTSKTVNLPPKKLKLAKDEDRLTEIPDETYHPGTYIDLDLFSAEREDLFSSAAKAVVTSSRRIPDFPGSKGRSLSKEETASMKYVRDSFKAMCVSLRLCIDGINRNPPGPEMSAILVHSANWHPLRDDAPVRGARGAVDEGEVW